MVRRGYVGIETKGIDLAAGWIANNAGGRPEVGRRDKATPVEARNRVGQLMRERSPLLEWDEVKHRVLCLQTRVAEILRRPEISLTADQARNRLIEGQPLLAFDEIPVQWGLARSLFHDVLEVLTGQALEIDEVSVERDEVRAWTRAWYEGQPVLAGTERCWPPDELLRPAAQATMRPFLMSAAKSLSTLLAPELWRRSYCPICGGRPDLAFLERETGARWLVCADCDTSWLFQRLQCPFCDNCDHGTLGYFVSGGNGSYRLYVCDRCKGYLKAVDLRRTQDEFAADAERYLSAPLDQQARGAGYASKAAHSYGEEGVRTPTNTATDRGT